MNNEDDSEDGVGGVIGQSSSESFKTIETDFISAGLYLSENG